MRTLCLILGCLLWTTALCAPVAAAEPELAEENAAKTRRAIRFCQRFVHGWLNHADPASGLIPRNLGRDFFWNAKDAAADNFPFMLLTAFVTGTEHLKRATLHMMEEERRLTSRLDSLPDDFLFATQSFRTETQALDDLIFGASEYAKDGLMPITEWLGPGPWLERMRELVRDIWKHAPHDSAVGRLPSRSQEVNGELLQVMSRLYWQTRDDAWRTQVFRLADHYFLHESILEQESLRLDDHGCEVIGGLSEAYLVASRTDTERWERYRPRMHAILDRVLAHGANPDGFLYNTINPRTGAVRDSELTDNWGYNYNAFLVVAEVDREDRFREAVRKVLSNLHKYLDYPWEGRGADGYADTIEGGINLLNRIGVASGFDWVDRSMEILLAKQRDDGIIEGWHGDGNSARTAIMYALWKSQGISLSPWREDLQLGAVREEDGRLQVYLKSEWPWRGRLRFDRPRHRDYLRLPFDYARINQFPEWFTVAEEQRYRIVRDGEEPRTVDGRALRAYELELKANEPARLTVSRAE